jgi:hypothetical protein
VSFSRTGSSDPFDIRLPTSSAIARRAQPGFDQP